MGHDITAFTATTTEPIAHLRIGGRFRRATHLYRALGADQYNAKDSGIGFKKTVTLPELKKAANCTEITTAEEIFIHQCISHCSKDGIEILFS